MNENIGKQTESNAISGQTDIYETEMINTLYHYKTILRYAPAENSGQKSKKN